MSGAANRSHDVNVAVGRKSQQAGAAWEAWLAEQDRIAERVGILAPGTMLHTEPRVLQRGAQIVRAGKSGADRVGVLVGGRAVAVEAKSTNKARLARDDVSEKQQAHLDAVARAGGLALLLVEFRSPQRPLRYAVEWRKVPWGRLRSAETVGPELVGWEVVAPCYLARFVERDVFRACAQVAREHGEGR